MQVALRPSPVLPPSYSMALTERKSIHRILREAGAPDWFMDFGVIRLNGVVVPREQWRHVKVKPDAEGLLELCEVPQKGNLLPILASVALVAATAGIGTFGVPFLGIAAGSFAAAAAAAAVGIAGQIALSQLTAPPSSGQEATAQRELSQAGIQANQINLFEPLQVVFGTMLVSPSIISPAYTTFDKGELTVHAIVGAQGRCRIENILINGIDSSLVESLEIESREGGAGDAPLTIAQRTVIQPPDQVTISKWRTEQVESAFDELTDQTNPAESAPDYHYFKTKGDVDEIWIRLMMASGLVYTLSGTAAGVPLRIEVRKVGDVAWRNLPTCHITDPKLGGGPLRVEIKLKFQKQSAGRHFSNVNNAANTGGEWPIYELDNITGIGQSFEYESDAYFQQVVPTNLFTSASNPVMTAATTSGVTMSASSSFGAGNEAWKASDNSAATAWRPAANSLPAWLKWDFGSAVTLRSWYMDTLNAPNDAAPTNAPTEFYMEGSNDDINWTRLDPENHGMADVPLPRYFAQIEDYGSYRYYRLNITQNNGAASQEVQIGHLFLYTWDAPGTAVSHDSNATASGHICRHAASTTEVRSIHGSLTEEGATFFLDPAEWLPGTYEVRIKRGRSYEYVTFQETDYSYAGVTGSDFFEYFTSSGKYVIRYGQKFYRDDMTVETFSSVSDDIPVDTTGIACIALALKNTEINSISAQFTRYAPIYSGGVWTDAEQPTSNPAALYRALELGAANPVPTPGEIIDEDAFATWYARCEALGYEANFIAQSKSLAEVKGILSYCGYASPRDSAMVSIAEDYDRSGDVISQMLSPLNSRNLGTDLTLPKMPDAIYAEYFDASDDYKVRRDIIYRTGFDVNTAVYFDTITYEGFTDTAKVAARAAFDLLQMEKRSRAYSREIGIEGYSIARGDLIGLNDDTLDQQQACGLIRSIQTSGGNITGITVDTIIAFSGGQDNFEEVADVSSLTDVLDTDVPFGVAIRIAGGTSTARPLSNVTDSNVCTFTTPFTEAGSGIEVGQLAVFGISGREYRRAIVVGIDPNDLETRTLILRDEAPELFA